MAATSGFWYDKVTMRKTLGWLIVAVLIAALAGGAVSACESPLELTVYYPGAVGGPLPPVEAVHAALAGMNTPAHAMKDAQREAERILRPYRR
jgi:hypothetical protein